MLLLSLFAQRARPAGSPLDRPEFIWAAIGLVVALLAGAAAFYFLGRWWKQNSGDETGDAGTELTSFRAMYERGEITEEEYTRLRQRVADRVRTPPATAATGPAALPGLAGGGPAAPGPPTGPVIPGPLPPDYFDDPELPGRPPGENTPPA